MSIQTATILAYGLLIIAIAIGGVFFNRWRKRGAPVPLALLSAWVLLSGLLFTALISLHTGTIIVRALQNKGVEGEPYFTYNFRFYSLMLLGFAISLPAMLSVFHASKIARGDRGAWKVALVCYATIFIIVAPLLPIQRAFSIGFTIFSGIALILLFLAKNKFSRFN